MTIEDSLVISFKKVKGDIEDLQKQILKLNEKIADIDYVILEKERKKSGKKATNKRVVKKKPSKKKTKKK